jgi:hypothetical protein
MKSQEILIPGRENSQHKGLEFRRSVFNEERGSQDG